MSHEVPHKRERYSGWIVVACLLLLLAASFPVALKYFGSREVVMDLNGDPGGQITWRMEAGGRVQTGVTNLPVKLVFRERQMEFTAQRTNYTGPLVLSVRVGIRREGSTLISRGSRGVRYKHTWDGWSVSPTPWP